MTPADRAALQALVDALKAARVMAPREVEFALTERQMALVGHLLVEAGRHDLAARLAGMGVPN